MLVFTSQMETVFKTWINSWSLKSMCCTCGNSIETMTATYLNHCTSCLDGWELISILGLFPSVRYGMLVWGLCGQVSNLESIHVRAAKIIFNLDWCTSGKEVLTTAKYNTLEIMYEKRLLILAHQAYYHLLPCPMICLFKKYLSSNDHRRKMTFKLLRAKADMGKKSCS